MNCSPILYSCLFIFVGLPLRQDIRDPSDRQVVHQVGGISDDEFSRLFSGMYWTIMSEALKLVLSLPASVFNLLLDKVFKSIF